MFQLSGAPIKKAVTGPREDAEGIVVVEDESAFGDQVFEEEFDKADDPELDIQSIKYIKENTKKRKAAAGGSGSGTKKLKSKK